MFRYFKLLLIAWKVRRDRRVRAALATVDQLSWRQRIAFVSALARDPRLPWRVRAAPFLVAAYLIWPVDFIPDFIPVLGQLDDVAFMGFVFRLVHGALPPALVEEHLRRAAATPR